MNLQIVNSHFSSICQINRSRNKWKFYLKDGIMSIGGKDYVFQKSNGDAEW
jgi:transcription initiation factor TFIIA large subunit